MENDIRIDRTKLHPYLDYMLGRLLKYSNKEGIYLIITEGYRTVEKQNELYAQGRTTGVSGQTVTNAKGTDYESQHQWGIAFDIAIKNTGHTWDYAYFKKVADIAKKYCKALGWGGDWIGYPDNPHFYLKKWGSTTYSLKKQYVIPANFTKTWQKTVKGTKKGLSIRNKTRTKVLLKKQPNGTVFDVLWQHRIWSKVRCNGVVGYSLTRFLK